MEPNCVSYNFKKTATKSEDHKCELNNSTHEGHENELEEDPSYKYHGEFNRRNNVIEIKLLLRMITVLASF